MVFRKKKTEPQLLQKKDLQELIFMENVSTAADGSLFQNYWKSFAKKKNYESENLLIS